MHNLNVKIYLITHSKAVFIDLTNNLIAQSFGLFWAKLKASAGNLLCIPDKELLHLVVELIFHSGHPSMASHIFEYIELAG